MVGWHLFFGKNETDLAPVVTRWWADELSLSGVWWKASVRACGHIFVQHHPEHREAVIPASEE